MEKLKKYFIDKPVETILDVATGQGQFLRILSDFFPKAKITGIDPDAASLKIAEKTFQEVNIRFFQMYAEKLGFQNGQFDLVSISNGLHHLPDLERSFSEMKRVAKPGGWMVINEHINDTLTPAQENQKFYHHLKSYADRLNGHFHRETWAKQEILDIIKENGINIESLFEYSDGRNIITQTRPVAFWTDQLKKHIEILKHKPVYKELLPKLKEFKQRIEKDGMQQVNNVVVIGRITKQPD